MDKLEKPVVLIVDDTPVNIKVLGNALKDDYLIKIATNGEEALKVAANKPVPDLILLDIMMPEMDGYEVCAKLKEMPEAKGIPVIFVTALNKEGDEERGLGMGAIDYITKPYSIPILKARIKNHIELKKLRDQMKANSMRDGLTEIANKRKFEEVLRAEWSRGDRYQEPLALLLLDIDFFKNFNDKYGHLEGDDCLKKVAKALQEHLKRGTDLVARWGGEEFACILSNTTEEGALQVAEELRQKVENLKIVHETSDISEYVTISAGVAIMTPDKQLHHDEIVKKADEALYKAKQNGRNRVEII